MTRVDITSYLASCHSLAVEAIQRLLPIDSVLQPSLCNLVAQPSGPSAGLRSALCLATCRALGGLDDDALPATCVLEAYHNAFDPERAALFRPIEPAPSLPRTSNYSELASHAPNAMLALAFEPLLEQYRALGDEQALKVLQVVGRMARESTEGRAIEMSWVRSSVWALSDADYRGMVLKRVGWRGFVAPVKIGAIVAGANGEQLALLEQFAADLGFAFQLYDDVIELSRTTRAFGLSWSPTREAKHTLPLMHALRVSPAEHRTRMEQVLCRIRLGAPQLENDPAGAPEVASEDIDFLYDRIRLSGGGEYAQDVGKGYALRARAALDRARAWIPNSVHGGLLYALADFTIAKVF